MKIDGRCLFVWRHADAGEPLDDPAADLQRTLTVRGNEQAQQAAAWLDSCLPGRYKLLTSPAPRALQTAGFVRKPETLDALAPGQPVADLRAALAPLWPGGSEPVVLVGHQPQLGYLLSALVTPTEVPLAIQWPLTIRKAGIWVLRQRPGRDPETMVLAVRDPGFSGDR